jgi:molecular chaperone GrpE (heat shock protein)
MTDRETMEPIAFFDVDAQAPVSGAQNPSPEPSGRPGPAEPTASPALTPAVAPQPNPIVSPLSDDRVASTRPTDAVPALDVAAGASIPGAAVPPTPEASTAEVVAATVAASAEQLPVAIASESGPVSTSPPIVESQPYLSGVESRIDDLCGRVEEFKGTLEREVRREELNRQTFTALNDELKSYKEDFLGRAQAPMLKALIRLLDDIDDMGVRGETVTSKDLKYLGEQVVEILENYGAEDVSTDVGAPVDGSRHKVIRTKATDDPDSQGLVAEVRGRAWTAAGRSLKQQNVVVYSYVPAEEPSLEATAPAAPLVQRDTSTDTGLDVPATADSTDGPVQEGARGPATEDRVE